MPENQDKSSETGTPKSAKPIQTQSTGEKWTSTIAAVTVLVGAVAGVAKGVWETIQPTSRAWVLNHWYLFLGSLLLLLVFTVFSPLRRKFRSLQETTRVGLTIFILLPAVFLVVNGVVFLQPRYQVTALRSVFFVAVCLFPVSLYYLFIATRKYGLLNEFVLNLNRLGLLSSRRHAEVSPEGAEGDSERQLRISTYLQRFQAVYGRLAMQEEIDSMLKAESFSDAFSRSMLSRNISQSLASIFTTGATVPVFLATVLIALGWLLTLPPWQWWMKDVGTAGEWTMALRPEEQPICFAFLGAYFFSIQMLFRRFVRRDLRSGAYVSVSLRIILATIGTWVILHLIPQRFTSSPKPSATALVTGFVVGVFPPLIWQILRQFIKKTFRIDPLATTIETQLPITDLDGLNLWHRTRLEEEDIENVHSMATADLVDLMLNTRFPADRIIDWVDQAILYTALGPDAQEQKKGPKNGEGSSRADLRKYGIRTASSLVYAHQRDRDRPGGSLLEGTLKDYPDGSIKLLIDTLWTNPNLELIQNWRRLSAIETPASATAAA